MDRLTPVQVLKSVSAVVEDPQESIILIMSFSTKHLFAGINKRKMLIKSPKTSPLKYYMIPCVIPRLIIKLPLDKT